MAPPGSLRRRNSRLQIRFREFLRRKLWRPFDLSSGIGILNALRRRKQFGLFDVSQDSVPAEGAGAGAAALATGLTEVGWILREVRTGTKGKPKLTFRWDEFVSNGGLFLWEAFVSGKAKTKNHADDAERAVRAFDLSLPDPPRANRINEPTVMSLVGAAALWTGWTSDPSILKEPCLVISPDAN